MNHTQDHLNGQNMNASRIRPAIAAYHSAKRPVQQRETAPSAAWLHQSPQNDDSISQPSRKLFIFITI